MIEIRFHGRGGQGVVTAANIIANAGFNEGYNVQAFPFFGVERRGAPVTAFARISEKEIKIRCFVYNPDYVVVLDKILLRLPEITQGLKVTSKMLINTPQLPENFDYDIEVHTVDATSIALNHKLGSKFAPIINTPTVSAFAKITEIISLESVISAIKQHISKKIDNNINAAKDAWNAVI